MVTTHPNPMRLFVLGATGGTGRALVEQGLGRGHSMTAFVRSPQKLAPREGLTILGGDPLSTKELTRVLPGHDAVFFSLGPPGIGPTTVLREGARALVPAMKATGIRRLLVVSAAVLFENEGFIVWLARHTFLRNVYEDGTAMERVFMESDLDWTFSRPPRLTNGPLTREYRIADGRMPPGTRVVSRNDVAHFLLDEAEQDEHLHRIVGMAAGKPLPAERPILRTA
ncbi:Flavin reductase [Labilithrix luteola]|uniref:Flavin reductase n=1 Tax=Labilithrix luteola TaxID=1391654 RepID=A0A0K1PR36_9BACT|nr:SDR family oxidoreductase [Labilithrix luteola]AKU96005.1 Flavin reductase [Labilithrix luteola]